MKIKIGTANKVKVEALREVVAASAFLGECLVEGVDTGSFVGNQPKSLRETVRGAKNRAKAAFKDCDFSVGIEDGLMDVPDTLTGCMNIGICAFYNGKIMRRATGQNHLRSKKSGNTVRAGRKWVPLNESEAKKIRKLIVK